jgi:A/G-specific adenine glycosylase
MPTSGVDERELRQQLLAWFDAGRRDLPWRRTSDPYRIWVSEVMLQQTQVDRVVGFYERFTTAFPTVEALAAAPLDDVLKLWEGLGYYARARALHAAARHVAEELGGRLPERAAGLRSLPGFGPYTAAAVASIAFDEPVAALDTNVLRVLARVGCVDGPVARRETRAALEQLAARLVDPDRPGDFNQAMMELGAMVCRPRAPRCLLCPLAAVCCARASGEPERWPEAATKTERPTVHAACGVVRRRGRLLVVRRPDRGLLGGLWEFPGARLAPDEPPERACERGVAEKSGVRVAATAEVATVHHTFSHFRVVLHAFACRDLGGRAHAPARWATPDEVDALALTRTAREILRRGVAIRESGEENAPSLDSRREADPL